MLFDVGDYLMLLAGCPISTVTESPVYISSLVFQSNVSNPILITSTPFFPVSAIFFFFSFPSPLLLLLIVANSNFMGAISSLISQDQIKLALVLVFLFSLRWAVLFGHHYHYLPLCYFPSVSDGPWFGSFLWMKAQVDWHRRWFGVSSVVCTSVSWADLFLEWLTNYRPHISGWGINSRKNKQQTSWGPPPSPRPSGDKCQNGAVVPWELITQHRPSLLSSLAPSLSQWFSQQPIGLSNNLLPK